MNNSAILALPSQNTVRQYISFRQDSSNFGVELAAVREVLPFADQPVTPVPNTLPNLLGLTNLKGEILAVADFGRTIGAEPVDYQDTHSRIIVLEATNPQSIQSPSIRLGLAVSQVVGVLTINSEQIDSTADVSSEVAPFLIGFYQWQGALMMILDAEAIIHCDRW